MSEGGREGVRGREGGKGREEGREREGKREREGEGGRRKGVGGFINFSPVQWQQKHCPGRPWSHSSPGLG